MPASWAILVIFGAAFLYVVWVLSEPVSQFVFSWLSMVGEATGLGAIPEIDSRALQMRVFVLGLVITLALRFAPKGLIPEVIQRHGAKKDESAEKSA